MDQTTFNQNGENQLYSSNDATPLEKPIIQPQDQFPPPVQPAYPPNQVIAIPIQQANPLNVLSQTSNSTAAQIQYQNYTNISQVPHKKIRQTDENTFCIPTACFFKCFPFIFFLAGIGFAAIGFINLKELYFIMIFGLVFSSSGILMGFVMYNDVYFIMGPNTLMIMQKALFRKKIITYNPGEIERVDFNYNYGYQYDDDGGGYMHSYTLNVVLKNGKTNNYYNLSSSSKEFTNEEIAYFLYFINSHIRTKMFA